ncbi:MAG TPA: penicillin-insensitive murein endopeptidase [Vicinamibacterales bacterium]|jgi:penicillin-insensitive murein endopeptidase
MLMTIGLIAGLWLAVLPAPGATERPAAARSLDSPAALLELNDEELLNRIETDPNSLGSLSIGIPRGAVLVNAVALPAGPRWEAAPNADSWGTSETMAAIQTAVDTVHELFPDTPPIVIGDISARCGGHLKRHTTHQGGRDVDFGFYYKTGKSTWFAPGTSANLDLPRNWALVRAFLTRTDVETILLDTRIQRSLYQYALGLGEDKEWLDRVFQFSKGSRGAIICHVAGHRTHYHVRFFNGVAQELGRRARPLLVQAGLLNPPVYTVRHVVRRGETLGHLATRYGTTIRAIMQANGLAAIQLRAGRAYRIPRQAAIPPTEPVVVRQRLLPPQTPEALAAVAWPSAETLYGTTSDR